MTSVLSAMGRTLSFYTRKLIKEIIMIITKYSISVILGYLLGSINPAAIISKIKKTDIRKDGTGNLGATNVGLHFGKAAGAFVMLFDMLKAVIAVKIAEAIFPQLRLARLVAGCSAVLGHMFPFYLKFKGGKGLASFGGMVLAINPIVFLILLTLGLILMFVFNYGVALMTCAAILFPFLGAAAERSVGFFIIAAAMSAILLWRFRENFTRIRNGEELKVRELISRKVK